ncbi:MAG: dephospho-CoA kinase [Paludibacteraceae bacterium]|nr:dephospho-CoA kinase [Paludibacteraceae bacterium]
MIGLTGGIGSGKSTIAKELAKRGFVIYDCDREAKRIIAENKEVQQAIIDLLGEEAFLTSHNDNGLTSRIYNTSYVAQRVFENPKLLKQLNNIVHPRVKADICLRKPDVVESAILFEAGIDELCDKIVIVEAPEEVRIKRTIHRDYQDRATPEIINKVRARIRAQKTSASISQRPVLTVNNDGVSVLSRIVDLVCHFATH